MQSIGYGCFTSCWNFLKAFLEAVKHKNDIFAIAIIVGTCRIKLTFNLYHVKYVKLEPKNYGGIAFFPIQPHK